MNFNFIDFAAKLLVINVVLFFVTYLTLLYIEPEYIITEYALPISIMIAINSVMRFIYPAAILFTRTRRESYDFLKSWWHYVAIAISILSWITVFS